MSSKSKTDYSVLIAQAAEEDIHQTFLWYEDQKDNLGALFQDYITQAIGSIQLAPLKTQIRYKHIRIFFLHKFSYGIHFSVNKIEKRILILAVFHTSRDSQNWKGIPNS